MIKLNIFNMKEFLKIVEGCSGEIRMVDADGRKENIYQKKDVQRQLMNRYEENKNYLQLTLDIPNARDYLRIVHFSIGNL